MIDLAVPENGRSIDVPIGRPNTLIQLVSGPSTQIQTSAGVRLLTAGSPATISTRQMLKNPFTRVNTNKNIRRLTYISFYLRFRDIGMRLSVERSMSDKIQESLMVMIRERALKPGDQIPTEIELCELLGVGRSSLREAVAQMISHGLLSRMQGRGTFIRQISLKLEGGLDDLMSVTDMIRSVGATPSTRRLQFDQIKASENLAAKLRLGIGDDCVRIERVRCADDAIAAYCIDIVPKRVFDAAHGDLGGESLFAMFERTGRRLSHTHTSIKPTILTPRDLPELGDGFGLFLLLDEVDFDQSGEPICYSNDYYNTSIFKFDLVRKKR